ncbi:hypothetical protein BHU72_01025 [Desulfuribacillus stibiiarsenatis]|uniref:DNA 3'-5' helicase n=1 Tax=Desulfuribacillus stibiiarsenatis TaxID=1390249 RepID=A0A1E5LAD4_9FIRM|nr:RNA polymerase recycling motor HelD [Desulfuribacillus stibiiarsenatis]OEH87044.1 hypothetical protein BHU72_01025 [Desulfuribacillus stibiiarsenatis]
MTAKKHPDYKGEVNRLELTKEYIDKTLDATETYQKIYSDNIKEAMIELDYLDSSQSYINILINNKFMEMAEKNFESLTKSRNKPYFARIDIKQQTKDLDQFYIGKTSLFKAEDGTPLIIDWRSPIANLYYESRLGETSYEAEGQTQQGELILKRQYTIENGQLVDILDIDITTNDTFLQASLEAHADQRLKDIASTIQAEQNRVIRADMGKPLIVQGVAGSGKTTIALHRIAYFIYTYEKTFKPENLMIMAPNRLFINYISEVLPELGVERVKQTTFIDFMVEVLGNKYKMIDPTNTLIDIIHRTGHDGSNKDIESILWTIRFKGSMDFKGLLDEYVKDIETQFIPKGDCSLVGYTVMSETDIREMFTKDLNYLPVYKRVKLLKAKLSKQLKQVEKDLLKEIEEFYDQKIDRLRVQVEATEKRRLKIVSLLDRKEEKLETVKKAAKVAVKKYIDRLPKLNVFEYYNKLMVEEGLFELYFSRHLGQAAPLANTNTLCVQTAKLLKEKKITVDDYAPIVYIKSKLFGFDENITVKGLIVDEAQDFSVFQYYVLKHILMTNVFTLLGDLSQGIHSYRGINDWDELREHVFGRENSTYLTLVQSYRTTIEVMNLANRVIRKLNNPNIVLAQPVIRHGQRPEIKEFAEKLDLLKTLHNTIIELKKENFKSIAMICKTKQECVLVQKYLSKHAKIETKILDEKEENYEADVVIVPSYFVKGLEFDVSIIINIEEKYEDIELDIKLLYVALTRPLHRLYMYHLPNMMPLLS